MVVVELSGPESLLLGKNKTFVLSFYLKLNSEEIFVYEKCMVVSILHEDMILQERWLGLLIVPTMDRLVGGLYTLRPGGDRCKRTCLLHHQVHGRKLCYAHRIYFYL